MTNFEKIKAMTANELAEWIDKFTIHGGCTMCIYRRTSSCNPSLCIEGREIWLELEATDEQ